MSFYEQAQPIGCLCQHYDMESFPRAWNGTTCFKARRRSNPDGLTFCALWNHVPFHQPLEVGLFASSYVTRLLLSEPCLSQSLIVSGLRRVQNVGGKSSALAWAKGVFSVRSGRISETLLDNFAPSNHADNLNVISNALTHQLRLHMVRRVVR